MKKLRYILMADQVVIFNVLAYDSQGRSSAYLPSEWLTGLVPADGGRGGASDVVWA